MNVTSGIPPFPSNREINMTEKKESIRGSMTAYLCETPIILFVNAKYINKPNKYNKYDPALIYKLAIPMAYETINTNTFNLLQHLSLCDIELNIQLFDHNN